MAQTTTWMCNTNSKYVDSKDSEFVPNNCFPSIVIEFFTALGKIAVKGFIPDLSFGGVYIQDVLGKVNVVGIVPDRLAGFWIEYPKATGPDWTEYNE
jgi:hypothetical protein